MQSPSCGAFVTLLLLIHSHGSKAGAAIHNARVRVIEPLSGLVRRGHAATLECEFEINDAKLYMVKWYRGSREFYRYVPNEKPPTKLFPVPGIEVDLSKSDAHKLRINGTGFSLAGNYSCEVSLDGLLFRTVTVTHDLRVVELPPRAPKLVAERGDYEPDDTLRANCTSGPARPAPLLHFYINEMLVGAKWTKYGVTRVDTEGLETSQLELELRLRPPYAPLPEGTLRLRCEARVLSVYAETSLLILNPRRVHTTYGSNQPRPERVTSPNGSTSVSTINLILPLIVTLLLALVMC